MGGPAEVINAADARQVRRADRKDNRRESRRLDSYRQVLQTAVGRSVFWDILTRCGMFRSVWRPSAEIHYLAGKQDSGHELYADLVRASEEMVDLMHREARARERQDDREREAAHVAYADSNKEGA